LITPVISDFVAQNLFFSLADCIQKSKYAAVEDFSAAAAVFGRYVQ
jgi:hypothetical protein